MIRLNEVSEKDFYRVSLDGIVIMIMIIKKAFYNIRKIISLLKLSTAYITFG